MNTQSSQKIATKIKKFSVINDENFRGIIASKEYLSSEQLNMLIEDLEDSDPDFLASMHKEYKEDKKNNSFISLDEIEKKFSL
jgi:hypothetical protein